MIKRTILWTVLVLLLAGPAAWADEGPQPINLPDGFTVQVTESKPAWMCIGISVLALGGVCAVAFKNARRTHLD